MNFFALAAALLPTAEEIFKAIASAIAAGKHHADIAQIIGDHLQELPGKIRAV